MKKFLSLFMVGVLALTLISCGKRNSNLNSKDDETNEKSEIIVFAAASMTETLEEIAREYNKLKPQVTITFNFDSSGSLKTQIEEGAQCDIFISAAQKQMDQIDIESTEANKEGLDFVDSSTRVNLLENRVTLVVSDENKNKIVSFEDVAEKLEEGNILLAMGNSDVPVGQYTKKILDFFNLKEEELAQNGVLTYGTNVKEVTTQVKEGSVDAGIIYCTDAYSAGLTIVDYADLEMCGQVIYPAAVIKNSKVSKVAVEFLEYLQGDEAMDIFQQVGFVSVE